MPSAIDSTSEFQARSDAKRCWAFFTDLENIGRCIPGCESVTLLPDGAALLQVKLSVGYITRSFELKARFKEKVPESKVSFVGEGSDADVSGTVEMRAGESPGYTVVTTSIRIRPLSVLGRTAVSMFGADLVKKQADAFATCARSKLE